MIALPKPQSVEHVPAHTSWRSRLREVERIRLGEHDVVAAAVGEGAWWIVWKSGARLERYDDRPR